MKKDEKQKPFIAERLRQARKYSGLSQGQVASMLDMHRPTITEIEAGRRRVSAEELSEMAKIYDVSTSWLLGEDYATGDTQMADFELAARELSKLKKDDIDVVLKLLRTFRNRKGSSS